MGTSLPLADVKILDFMWVMAGPAATRVLADYGAVVIHVESSRKIDAARTIQPFFGGQPGQNNSAFFHNLTAGKLGITIDVTQPAGRAVALDLVRWCDVLTESFSPGVMRSLALDYGSLRPIKPDLVMLSTSTMGQTGPLSGFAGFGNLSAAYAGFHCLTGWPDREPAGPFGAYTDFIAPFFTSAAILAALEHRRRTGEGQYIDISQMESALQFLTPALLDFTVNSHVQSTRANDDPDMAPHGVYPAYGEDRWVAIAARTDEEWERLCRAMERPDLATDARFGSVLGRQTHAAELNSVIAAWTEERPPEGTEDCLQELGIPASTVLTGANLSSDPQLLHRGHFVQVPHPTLGTVPLEGSRFQLSRTPARVERAGPSLGAHTEYVLRDILGYGDDKIAGLVAAGALE